jgi:ATP-dependent Lon protease
LVAIEDPGRLADLITHYLKIAVAEQQAILETASSRARLERVAGYLAAVR